MQDYWYLRRRDKVQDVAFHILKDGGLRRGHSKLILQPLLETKTRVWGGGAPPRAPGYSPTHRAAPGRGHEAARCARAFSDNCSDKGKERYRAYQNVSVRQVVFL